MNSKFKKIILRTGILSLSINAFAGGSDLAKKFNLNPGEKAMKQWERVFNTPDKQKELGIDKLSDSEKTQLKNYLIEFAADSDKPQVAGK